MSQFGNEKKINFLDGFEERPSLHDKKNDLTTRSKFNFSYFDSSQAAGQKFSDWTHKQLSDLLEKLKNYTTESLDNWRGKRVGRGSLKILEIYGGFPKKSEFKEPKYIPQQAQWSRFRLGSKIRLVGFTVPNELHKIPHDKTGEFFDKNTF